MTFVESTSSERTAGVAATSMMTEFFTLDQLIGRPTEEGWFADCDRQSRCRIGERDFLGRRSILVERSEIFANRAAWTFATRAAGPIVFITASNAVLAVRIGANGLDASLDTVNVGRSLRPS